MMIRVRGIAIRPAKRAPMEQIEFAEITREKGVADDFRGTAENRQVTILSQEAWHKACQVVGRDLPWTVRRANLLVEGVAFSPADIGKTVRIGSVTLEITRETTPCSRMDEQCEGLQSALKPDYRGGVCCIVRNGGQINVGDVVEIG